jgi:hypothetical protein
MRCGRDRRPFGSRSILAGREGRGREAGTACCAVDKTGLGQETQQSKVGLDGRADKANGGRCVRQAGISVRAQVEDDEVVVDGDDVDPIGQGAAFDGQDRG